MPLTPEISRANGRKGGRPKGSYAPDKMKRIMTELAVKERIGRIADRLLSAQASLGLGIQILFKRNKDNAGRMLPAVKVTDEKEIQKYIDGELDNLPDVYYFITVVEPSGRDIDSMMNRAFGKPRETLENNLNVKYLIKLDD